MQKLPNRLRKRLGDFGSNLASYIGTDKVIAAGRNGGMCEETARDIMVADLVWTGFGGIPSVRLWAMELANSVKAGSFFLNGSLGNKVAWTIISAKPTVKDAVNSGNSPSCSCEAR